MKKFHILAKTASFILISMTLSGCGQQEVDFKDLDNRGARGVFLDREPFSGIVVEYRRDGSAESKTEVKDGFPEGWRTDLYRNGQAKKRTQMVFNHDKGRPDEMGEAWQYYENGEEGSFSYTNEEGNAHGTWKEWNGEGRLVREREFENGNAVGKHKRWNKDGLLVSYARYDDEGQKHGEFEETCDNEQVKFNGEYDHGQAEGSHQYWFCDGQLQQSLEFKLGNQIGKHEEYDSKGELILQGTYLEDGSGQKVGTWMEKSYDTIKYKVYGTENTIAPKYKNALFKTAGFDGKGTRNWNGYSSSGEDLKIYVDQGLINPNHRIPFDSNRDYSGAQQEYYSSWSYPVILAGDNAYTYLKGIGADLSAQDSEGLTRFNYCLMQFNKCSMEQLEELAPYANWSAQTPYNPIRVVSEWRLTSVSKYSSKSTRQKRKNQIARQLKVLDIARTNGMDMHTPLYYGSKGKIALSYFLNRRSDAYFFNYFIKYSNPNTVDHNGFTPLQYALAKGELNPKKAGTLLLKQIDQLVAAGADVKQLLPDGQDMKTIAFESGNLDFVKLIDKLIAQTPEKVIAKDQPTLADNKQPNEGGKISMSPQSSSQPEIGTTDKPQGNDTSPSNKVDQLLAKANEQLSKSRLTSPKDNNAYDSYKSVLQLEPSNKKANDGLLNISNKYIAWGESALSKSDISKAQSHLDKATMVAPQNRAISELESKLIMAREAQKQKEAEVAKTTTTTTQELPKQETPPVEAKEAEQPKKSRCVQTMTNRCITKSSGSGDFIKDLKDLTGMN
ncbi:MAG: hypothetical protein GQ547_01270 [Methylophaga sp.]|nr:hypothetical protein [Methylophaga sp.]